MRVKRSTLRALALVAPPDESAPPATWKLMEGNGRRRATAAAPDGSLDVGTLLRTTRRRRRISLDRAVRETCIPRRYVEALERNLPATAFPGALYARGFLRAYARYLRIADEEGLLARFEIAGPTPIELPDDAVPPPAERRRKVRIVALSVALIAAATIVATSGSSHPVKASFPATLPTIAPLPSSDVNAKAPAPAVPAATTPSITVEIAGARSWMRVIADGTTILPGRIVGPSFSQRFTAQRTLEIVAGNAAAVRVLFDGEWRGPLGRSGQVVTIVVSISDGVPSLSVTERA